MTRGVRGVDLRCFCLGRELLRKLALLVGGGLLRLELRTWL